MPLHPASRMKRHVILILREGQLYTGMRDSNYRIPLLLGNRLYYGWVILAANFVLATMVMGIYYCSSVFLTPLQDEFQVSRTAISSIFSISALLQSIFGVLGGWSCDKLGPRITFLAGGIIICIGLVLSSYVNSLGQLYLTYAIIVSIGIGVALPTGMATISHWFVKRRALAMGILTAGIACGMAVMPPVTQNLINNYGWRSSMFILGIAALVVYLINAAITARNPASVGLLPYGVTATDNPVTKTATLTTNSDDPTLNQALKGKNLWLMFGIFGVLSISVLMITTHIVRYALDIGAPTSKAALIMTIIGIGGMIGKIGGGALSEKLGSRKIIIMSSIALCVTMVWLTTLKTSNLLLVFALPFGIAYGGWVPNISLLIAEMLGTTHYGKMWAVVQVGGGIGGMIGPLLAGYLFDTTGSYRTAFLTGAGVTLITIIFVFLLKKKASAPIPATIK